MAKESKLTIPTPQEIKDYLDQFVIGQDEAKKTLAVAVHNHYRRVQLIANDVTPAIAKKYKDIEVDKSNLMLIGPSGTGKTLLARSLAKLLGVPFAIADATTLTQAGYVGEDVENVVRYLWQNAEYNVPMTQIGIIYIDEIDKIASCTNNVSITRDVSGEGVQQALLKIVEGTTCRFPPNGGRKHPDQQLVEIDTSNILFICGGAFVGLDDIIKNDDDHKTVGFGSISNASGEDEDETRDIQPQDLVKFGLIPEFVGRIPVVTKLEELKEEDLVRILTEPKNAIVKQYQKLLALDGIDLSFKRDALLEIAKISLARKTGARGLRSVIEKIMNDIMFSAPSDSSVKSVVITKDTVVNAFKKRRKDAKMPAESQNSQSKKIKRSE